MIIRKTLYAQDENWVEVMLGVGDEISEITDAGPDSHLVPLRQRMKIAGQYHPADEWSVTGWNVSFRIKPTHGLWTEIVTCDAVQLLKALEG